MKARMRGILLGLLLCAGNAQALNAPQEQEIAQLLNRLERSGCQFVRNGSVYSAPDAVAHLKRKLDATRDKLTSTEQFIDYVASKSSITNKPYEVQCPNKSSVTAKIWLDDLLKQLRKK